MKKLQSLNQDLFKGFEKNEVTNLNKIYGGGTIPSCTADLCQDTRTLNEGTPDEVISTTTKDCFY